MPDSEKPHRRQPTRLLRPWDSPGKNTGVGCHFLSNAWKWKVKVKSLSRVWLFTTPWTAAYQAPASMRFSRQEYWSGVPLLSPLATGPPAKSPAYLFLSPITYILSSENMRNIIMFTGSLLHFRDGPTNLVILRFWKYFRIPFHGFFVYESLNYMWWFWEIKFMCFLHWFHSFKWASKMVK